MNCDQVFDILTRGPFPSGEPSDAAVERHLCACHECRELAEALQPAVSLLHESIGAEEGADLPGYRGALWSVSDADRLADTRTVAAPSIAAQVSRRRLQDTAERGLSRRGLGQASRLSPRARATLLRAAGAATLAGALALLVVGLIGLEGGGDNGQPGSTVALAPSDNSPPTTLAALELLPRDCYRLTSAAGPSRHDAALCCTHCHVQDSLDTPPLGDRLMLVTRSCHLCHES
jgi:hypothetical protein